MNLKQRIIKFKQKRIERAQAKKKGSRRIGINYLDAIVFLWEKYKRIGLNPKEAAHLSTRISATKRALNRMGVGNTKEDPYKMHRIFRLIEEDFKQESIRRNWGKEESNQIQEELLKKLSIELGGPRKTRRFVTEFDTAISELKTLINSEKKDSVSKQ